MAQSPKGIEAHQSCSTITGPTGQPRSDGNVLVELNARSKICESGPLSKQLCGLHHKVVPGDAQRWCIAAQRQPGIGGVGEVKTISKVDALHHHRQFMESVRA
ncbi:MAG: Uncharacterised protein [Synechococcus sp. CC9902]|nr:MAG: Uncharacterised protein [Synechococcus sp. CC9902]